MQTYQIKIEIDRASEVEMFLAIMKALHFVVEVESIPEQNKASKTKIRQFKGLLGKKSMESIDVNIANMRSEWERSI